MPEQVVSEPDYQALEAGMTRARRERIAAARDRLLYDPDDPALRARLYHGGGGAERSRG